MIKIIESLSPPIRFQPSGDKFLPGWIVQLINIDGTPCCEISNGTRPFGIVGEHNNEPYGLIPIWYESMTFQTDVYESKERFEQGDSLYVSSRGLLTTQKIHDESILMGHVISGPGYGDLIEVSWI